MEPVQYTAAEIKVAQEMSAHLGYGPVGVDTTEEMSDTLTLGNGYYIIKRLKEEERKTIAGPTIMTFMAYDLTTQQTRYFGHWDPPETEEVLIESFGSVVYAILGIKVAEAAADAANGAEYWSHVYELLVADQIEQVYA